MREEFLGNKVTNEGITRLKNIMEKKKEVVVDDGITMSYEKLYHDECVKHELTKIEASKYLKRVSELQTIIATNKLKFLNNEIETNL